MAAGERNLSLALWVLSLLASTVAAAATLYVRAEVMQIRVLIVDRINEAGQNYVTRREHDSLCTRVEHIEEMHRKP